MISFLTSLLPSWLTSEAHSQPPLITEKTVCDYDSLRSMYPIDDFLSRLEDIVGLPQRHFEVLYQTPIRLLACRLQHTPSTKRIGESLLVERLDQILLGMKYRESFIMPSGVAPEDIGLKRDLWRYATFFSLALCGLGPAVTSFDVRMGANGKNPETWNPFGKIPDIGTNIEYHHSKADDDLSSLLLAQLIFSPSSLGWLRQGDGAFSLSLATICSPSTDTLLGKVVCYALGVKDPPKQVVEPEATAFSARNHGQEFFKWLKSGCASHAEEIETLSMEIEGALAFKSPDIFYAYANLVGVGWRTVKNGFNKLEVHRINRNKPASSDFFIMPGPDKEKTKWLVIELHHFGLAQQSSLPSKERPDFLSWLKSSISDGALPNSSSNPLFVENNGYFHLVVPGIFKEFCRSFSLDEKTVEKEFLGLGVHLKNGHSDYFEFPCGNKTLIIIKLPVSAL